jgi:hypothetical protein
MTLIHIPQETTTGYQASAGTSGDRARRYLLLRSQANAPRPSRPGRSYFC